MNTKDFYKMCLELGASPDGLDFIVKRSEFVEWMLARGYAQRTIDNHAAPSRSGGVINRLMAQGVLEVGGVQRWRVTSMEALKDASNSVKANRPERLFAGNVPTDDGWIRSARLDDCTGATEWRLFRREYAQGCNNLKVVALGAAVTNKANYRMNSKHGKIIPCKDSQLLKQHRPDIFESLQEELQDI